MYIIPDTQQIKESGNINIKNKIIEKVKAATRTSMTASNQSTLGAAPRPSLIKKNGTVLPSSIPKPKSALTSQSSRILSYDQRTSTSTDTSASQVATATRVTQSTPKAPVTTVSRSTIPSRVAIRTSLAARPLVKLSNAVIPQHVPEPRSQVGLRSQANLTYNQPQINRLSNIVVPKNQNILQKMMMSMEQVTIETILFYLLISRDKSFSVRLQFFLFLINILSFLFGFEIKLIFLIYVRIIMFCFIIDEK